MNVEVDKGFSEPDLLIRLYSGLVHIKTFNPNDARVLEALVGAGEKIR